MYVRLTGLVPGVRVSDWSGSGPAGDCPADCRPSAHRIVGTETHCGTVPSVFISLQPLAALAGPCRGQRVTGAVVGGGGGGGRGAQGHHTSLEMHSVLQPEYSFEKPSSYLVRRKGQVTRSPPLSSSAGKDR